MKKIKTALTGAIGLVVLFVIIALSGQIGKESAEQVIRTKSISEAEKWVQDVLVDAAKEINRQTPTKLDDVTTLVSVEAKDTSFVYNYRLSLDKKEVDLGPFGRTLVSSVCKQSDMRISLRKGVAISYRYIDKFGAFISTITITERDCN